MGAHLLYLQTVASKSQPELAKLRLVVIASPRRVFRRWNHTDLKFHGKRGYQGFRVSYSLKDSESDKAAPVGHELSNQAGRGNGYPPIARR